jgi:hypothetical protein
MASSSQPTCALGGPHGKCVQITETHEIEEGRAFCDYCEATHPMAILGLIGDTFGKPAQMSLYILQLLVLYELMCRNNE